MSSPRNWKQDPRITGDTVGLVYMSRNDLEDEVMTLRGQLQITNNLQLETQKKLDVAHEAKDIVTRELTRVRNELADVSNQLCEMERDRDFWRREAEMWRQECNLRSGGHEWHTYSGAKKVARWNNNTGRYEPDPDDH